MKCKHAQQQLLDYSESQLDRKSHAMVEEHLRDCPVCAQDLKDFNQTVELLQSTPLQTPPEGFWDDFSSGVMRKVRRMDTPASSAGSAFLSKMKMGVVALATLLFVLGLALLYSSGSLGNRFPSFVKSLKPVSTEQPKHEFEAMVGELLPGNLVDDMLEADFALLGGGGLSSFPLDANDETLYLLIESLDEGEKMLLLAELEEMREELVKP